MRIDRFDGEYRFLSNMWIAPDKWNVEAEYQRAKCARIDQARKFLPTMNPFDAKKLSRTVELRPDWERRKIGVMIHYVREKFRNYPDIRDKLLLTGDAELIEGNDWCDTYWGVCGIHGCKRKVHRKAEGENWLGRILMEIRSDLLEEVSQ